MRIFQITSTMFHGNTEHIFEVFEDIFLELSSFFLHGISLFLQDTGTSHTNTHNPSKTRSGVEFTIVLQW